MKRHLVILVPIFAIILMCGFVYSGFILKITSNGSQVGIFTTYAVLDCGNAPCTKSNSTVTIGTARQSCDIVIGDTSGSALSNAQLGPQVGMCYVPYGATVLEVDVRADGGTPNVIVAKSHAGSVSNLVSSALATASAGGIACSKTTNTVGLDGVTTCSATLQNTAILTGDYIELVSGTAGGVAKLMSIHVLYQ